MTVGGDRRRLPRRAMLVVLTPMLLLGVTACTAEQAAGSSPVAAAGSARATTVPSDDERAIRRAVDRLDATAGGTVREQQAVLAQLVAPALAAGQAKCPTATSTVRIEPVYPALRPAAGWTAAGSSSLPGTVYALPSLLRSYTGDRITGTDLTTLHLGVAHGEAYVTPLCVS